MYKGTTPTIIFSFPETFDVTDASQVLVTISDRRGCPLVELTGDSIDVAEHSVSCWLSQEQTLMMPTGDAYAQINMLYADGQRAATNIVRFEWSRNLHMEVMR